MVLPESDFDVVAQNTYKDDGSVVKRPHETSSKMTPWQIAKVVAFWAAVIGGLWVLNKYTGCISSWNKTDFPVF